MIDTVPTVGGIRCHATTAAFQHRCPIKDEADHGSLHLEWTTTDVTLELHSLAGYLTAWRDTRITHESICDRITHDLTSTGVADVVAAFTGYTAGLTITTTAGEPTGRQPHAVLREPDHRGA